MWIFNGLFVLSLWPSFYEQKRDNFENLSRGVEGKKIFCVSRKSGIQKFQ